MDLHNFISECNMDIDGLRAAIEIEMKKKEIKAYVDNVHKSKISKITKQKNGKPYETYRTRVYVNKQEKAFTSTDLDKLYLKLYNFYQPDELSNKLSDIYQRYQTDRDNDPTIDYKTAKEDKGYWRRFWVGSNIEQMPVTAIKPKHIIQEYKRIVGYYEKDRKTFRKAAGILERIFDYAIQEELLEFNPAKNTPTNKLPFKCAEDHSQDVFSKEERAKLLHYLRGQAPSSYTLGVQLAFCFPVRIGELLALTWDDYDAANQMLHIHHMMSLQKGENGETFVDVGYLKKHGRKADRWLPVSRYAAGILEQLRELNGDKQYILNGQNCNKLVQGGHFNDHLKSYCLACNITYHSSHKARFYGITELYDAKVKETTIQRIAGHTDAAMTRHYNRPSYEAVDRDVWESIFGA